MLDLVNVSKQYATKVLFKNVGLHISANSRMALVGPNGAGKTTLLKIIMGLEEPDSGTVARASHVSIGHLAQEIPKFSDVTILNEVMKVSERREELLVLKDEFEEKFAKGSYEGYEEDLERYGHVLEELDHTDQYRLESRAKEILTGMGFSNKDFDRSLSEFSGGWLMRVALSRILLQSPDLMLLDEPTNHLDLESLLWLEEFLLAEKCAMLLISHDTAFLDRMVSQVVELDHQTLVTYSGNLASCAAQKEERLRLLQAQKRTQDQRIEQIEDFAAKFRYKATKARQVQSRLKQLEKLEDERIQLPDDQATIHFRFSPAPRSGKQVVAMEHVSLAFGSKKIFSNLDWLIPRGSRVAIVGVNGAGKTTLLRMLAGQLAPTSGEIQQGHQVCMGYYAQHQSETLGMTNTIFEELRLCAPAMPQTEVRAMAGAFLFSGDAVEKKCGVLSGGEKARVALAKILLTPTNFLLLDEPTNHLDVSSREVLLRALQNYEGTLCLVSHDRSFVSPLVDSVLEIIPTSGPEGSQVNRLVETYEEYLQRKIKEAAQTVTHQLLPETITVAPVEATAPAEEEEVPTAEKKTDSKQINKWDKERIKLENEIEEMEKKQKQIHDQLALPETYDDREKTIALILEEKELAKQLAARNVRWEKLCSLLKG